MGTYLYFGKISKTKTNYRGVNVMKKVVRIEFEVPDSITEEQFKAWAEYHLGWNGSISCENPIYDSDPSKFSTSFDISDY